MRRQAALLLFLALLAAPASAIQVEPLVAFPFEKAVLGVERPGVELVEMYAFYDTESFALCSARSCPVFENNRLAVEGSASGTYSILVGNAKKGNYLIRIVFEDGSTVYTSFTVRQNFMPIALAAVAVLAAILIGVELNAFKGKGSG